MEKKVIIITSIYWKYDILKSQPKQTIPVEFVCFTEDDSFPVEKWADNQWDIVVVNDPELDEMHPRMWAKRYRTHPFSALYDIWTEVEQWDIVIWMDWSARLLSEKSIENLLNQCPENFDICTFKHPERNDIYEEAQFCVDNNIPKYKDLPMLQQVERYRKKWYPEWSWLSATWLLIMKRSRKLEMMLDSWRYECVQYTYQDQLSFDYLVWKCWISRGHILDNLRYNDNINFLNMHTRPEE